MSFSQLGKLLTFLCERVVLFVQVCVCVSISDIIVNVPPTAWTNTVHVSLSLSLSLTQTFALAGAEAAALLAGGGGALVEGRGLLVTLTAGDFAMHLIGQVPQQTHAVLYQLQRWRENGGVGKRELLTCKLSTCQVSRCKYITSPTECIKHTLVLSVHSMNAANQRDCLLIQNLSPTLPSMQPGCGQFGPEIWGCYASSG